jgi:glutamate N-acetyltransferase/amino-acid N-acetyltransferase
LANYEHISNGSVTTPAGFTAVATACGLKKNNQLDLALIYSEQDCTGAAVFTKNQVVAAPVIVDREIIASHNTRLRGVVVNAGNANACTGAQGINNARAMQRLAAAALGCQPEQFLVLSTGVIGVQLPMEKIQSGIEQAVSELSPANGRLAAQAIMTTDTQPKHLAVTVNLPEGQVSIGGMAKGSGMIHPDMATMLSVLTTDAQIAPDFLDGLLQTAVNQSFNRISIDGDTSTNDTVLLLANGASGIPITDDDSIHAFGAAMTQLCTELAKMIVKDGEGATKFVEIRVTGAGREADAHTIANTIAISPLVKTAFAGSDPNWGRILMAAGRAGVSFDQHACALWISADGQSWLQLLAQGTPTDYAEADAASIFSQSEFQIHLQIGNGLAEAIVWTCDLSHDYVTINADYRT